MRYRFLSFPGGKKKAVTFSYDDGCREDIQFANTLFEFGLKGTFNLNSAFLGRNENDWHLTGEEIQKYLLNRGFEIANHGAEHRANGLLRPIEGIRDVLECRLSLEKTFQKIIRGMAYPDSGINRFQNGATYQSIQQYLKDLDIAYARTTVSERSFYLPNDWYAWNPTCHHSDSNIMDIIDEFLQIDTSRLYISSRYPRLFYLWGHSYEFEKNSNWSLLSQICEKLAGREDIWYATNMEIYEYVKAYESLIFSADLHTVYNPTFFEIWFEVDGISYGIQPGETLIVRNT